ncbi:MAG: MopE-related protein [Myxococcales bacterium]|nr:MopE-related protein [Myxococcales bacterium]
MRLLRLTCFLSALAALTAAPAFAQTCSAQIGGVQCNGNDPENDCDGDGCRRGFGDCNDCDFTIRGPGCPGGGPRPGGIPPGAGPELCDGKDNNCNASVDEGPTGTPGTVDGGLACTIASNQGVCRPGTTACQGTMGVVCLQNVMASMEVCDGRDNDCDGDTDETGGSGSPKLTQNCFPTPIATFGTPNVGICRNGQQACNAAANSGVASYTACGVCGVLATCMMPITAANPPGANETTCNGIDDDCDGTADDGVPGVGAACTVAGQQGRCAQGTQQCGGAGGLTCTQVNFPQMETCNGIDDDCDGFIDEAGATDFPKLKRSCFPGPGTAGQGICTNGEQACNATVGSGMPSFTACGACGALATCASPVTAVAEVCDTLDNDCDGTVNNGNPGGGAACTNTAAFGVCRAGTQTCQANGTIACNSTIAPGTQTEVCDGLDNDCDNAVDETGGIGSPTLSRVCYAGPNGTFTGTCGATPAANCSPRGECRGVLQVCPGAGGFPACGAGTPGADGGTQRFNVAEICNGRDDDCNGTNDNGNPGGGAMCTNDAGVGACTGGTVQCVGGALVCQGAGGTAEVCDGIDNDCDGDIDESGAPGSLRLSRLCYGGPVGTFTGSCQTTPPGTNCAPRGICRGVPIFCQGAAYPACSMATTAPDGGLQVFPGTEVCNALDDDCDGQLNEGLSGMACNTGLQGVCADGTEQCTMAGALLCVRNRDAGPELCNSLDDDCNGIPDDNVAPRICFDGPSGTFTGQCGLSDGGTQGSGAQCLTRGLCRSSTQQCNGAGNWLACGLGLPVNQQQTLPVPEICNGLDEDCNGSADNGLIIDADNDMVRACGTCGANPDGGCDCNDSNPNIRPGRIELCNGLDDNCNNRVDEASTGTGKISQNCYSGPANTAGRGVCVQGTQECNATPDGGMASFGACMGERVPSMETCNMMDDDCDGTVDNGFDVDNDGFRACIACGLSMNCDCDDTNPNIRPGAVELCDTIDQNCNGRLDDVTPRACFANAMGVIPPPSTYTGTCPGPTCLPRGVCRTGTQSCSMAGDWSSCMNVTLPRAEQCDGADDDCDGVVDNGNFDLDMDSYVSCALCGNRTAPDGGIGCDCNDADPAINPAAPEICDGIDNNCDMLIDGNDTACYSGPPVTRGRGQCADGLQTCTNGMGSGVCRMERLPSRLPDGGLPAFQPDAGVNDPEFLCDGIDEDCDGIVDDGFDLDGDGVTTCQNDCDDTDPFNKPGGVEICDCKDNNCNTIIDDSQVCRGAPCFDFDGDGFTNCQGDCNDDPNGGGRSVGPNRSEVVGDGLDNDCDGQVDENTDEDGDGFSTGGPMALRDCNDKLADVNPGAAERCDGFDNDCDGVVDEGFDVDGDFVATCAGDCNDMNPAVNPTRDEVCGNGIDDNCDGRIDEDTDNDGDGVSTCAGDCNDFNASVHGAAGSIAAAMEVCDGQDNNCNRLFDEGFDQDNDGTPVCFGDCDDTNPSIGPRSFEVPGNGIDDDCDGEIDEGQVDRDMDGFSPVCGDCNDFDARINPHAREVCNRVDDNCDAYVDSAPGRPNLCSVCFDADGDGQTNCDGDCNDADPTIFRGAPEICDLKDNDCDLQVDIDPSTGRRVCTGMEDAGAGVDGGDGGSDGDGGAGSPDGGGMVVEDDAGVVGPTTPGVVTTGCGCGATDGSAVLLAMGVLTLLARRRRQRSPARGGRSAVLFSFTLVALLTTGCPSSLTTPMFGTGGGSGGGSAGGDADAGPEGDAGVDAGFIEPENWPCPGLAPLTQAVRTVPGTTNLFALSSRFSVVENSAARALVYDDDAADLAGFVLQRDIPSAVDPLDPGSLETVATTEVDALIQLGGTPLVRDRLERSSRIFVNADRPLRVLRTLSTSQLLTLGTPTTAFAVRNRLLAALSGRDPATLGVVPQGPAGAVRDVEQVVNLFFRFGSGKLFIGVVVSPSTKLRENLAPLNDFSNGSHLADESASLATRCEKRVTPALKTDFLFVIDNTISMVEEQQALQDASDGLFAAFQRAGLDFRLGVVTTDSDILRGNGFVTTLNDFKAAARVGLSGNTTELGIEFGLRALRRARMSMVPNLTLRDSMTTGLVVIFMSDEDNKSVRPGMFGSYIADYRMEGAVAFSIVGPKPTGCIRVGRGEALPGDQYIDLANGTGGSSGSICNPNLTEVIEEVVIGALGASSRSALERRPISGSLAARTMMELLRNRSNGFDYEPAANSILFFGAAAPSVGGPYDAAYQFFNYID